MIQLSRVEKRYGRETLALQGITLNLGRGEIGFLHGPGGAGKTTLLKLLFGGERPTAGEVLVLGQAVTQLGAHEIRLLRRKMGLVFQDAELLPDLTVEENMVLPLRVSGIPTRTHHQRAQRMLDRLGVLKLARRLPSSLSAGEAQRVAIARALVSGPLLVLADEPTGNLDPEQAQEVMQLLLAQASQGSAMLIATHQPALLPNRATPGVERFRIFHLEGGLLRSEHPSELA